VITIFAAVRAIHFASLMLIWGGGAFLLLLQSQLDIRLPVLLTWRVAVAAAALAFITGVLWLLLVTGQMSGDWRLASNPATIFTVVTETRFGHVAAARIASLILLSILAIWRTPDSILAGLGAVLLGSLGLTSHAAASNGSLGLALAANDALHLLTAGFWIGGLVVLVWVMRLNHDNSIVLLNALRLFSAWGVFGVGVLVLTGFIDGVSIVPLSAISINNIYVDILAAKIVLAFCMIGLAAVNRTRLLPRLSSGETGATDQLTRNIGAEIVLGCLIIAAVGYLGLTSPVLM
jgi:copper resistance protein D